MKWWYVTAETNACLQTMNLFNLPCINFSYTYMFKLPIYHRFSCTKCMTCTFFHLLCWLLRYNGRLTFVPQVLSHAVVVLNWPLCFFPLSVKNHHKWSHKNGTPVTKSMCCGCWSNTISSACAYLVSRSADILTKGIDQQNWRFFCQRTQIQVINVSWVHVGIMNTISFSCTFSACTCHIANGHPNKYEKQK